MGQSVIRQGATIREAAAACGVLARTVSKWLGRFRRGGGGRHGLCADLSVTLATESEPQTAVAMLERQRRQRHRPHTLAADRGYHCRGVVDWCRQHLVQPQVATRSNRQVPGLDGRTLRTKAYRRSQHIRRGVEPIFGWCKAVGGLRQNPLPRIARVSLHAQLVATAYNLLRIANLMPVAA